LIFVVVVVWIRKLKKGSRKRVLGLRMVGVKRKEKKVGNE